MASISSKAPPYPWSALINGQGVRTRGDIVGKNIQSLGKNVPTDLEYGDEDLYKERTFAFRCPLGMGDDIQHKTTSERCRFGINVWFSHTQRGKGPLWHPISPASTGPILKFGQALHAGVVTQFIFAGQYVLRRVSDASAGQSISKDFGAGRTVTSAARFKPTGGIDSFYVTLDNGELWQYDGTSWIGPAAAAGGWGGKAYFCVVVDNDFYIVDTKNTVRRCTADPMVGGNYSGQFEANDFGSAGDGSITITSLAANNKVVWIFADNGKVFTLNADGTSNDLLPGLQATPLPTNGLKPVVDTRGNLYFRNGFSWLRLDGAGNAEPVGPERLIGLTGEVNGVAQVFEWYEGYYGFFGVYNEENSSSYLIQFGDWLPGSDTDGFTFVESFNGALIKWGGKQISAMNAQYIGGVPRLYCGFTDGTYGYFRLPRNTPNPFAPDSGCEFTVGENGPSECYWPPHTMLKPRDNKSFLDIAEFGLILNPENYVRVSYKLDFSGLWTDLGFSFNRTGIQAQFNPDVYGTAIELVETFVSPNELSTPVIEALVLREQLRPALRMEWQLPIPVRHNTPLRNGGVSKFDPILLKRVIQGAAENPGSTSLTLPDEVVGSFSLVTYQETIHHESQRLGIEWDIDVSFVAYRTIELYGIIDRLAAMTIDDLDGLLIDDLGVL